jgi:hypothetical protein
MKAQKKFISEKWRCDQVTMNSPRTPIRCDATENIFRKLSKSAAVFFAGRQLKKIDEHASRSTAAQCVDINAFYRRELL